MYCIVLFMMECGPSNYFQNGDGEDINTKGQCILTLRLHLLPPNVTKFLIEWTLSVSQFAFNARTTKMYFSSGDEESVIIGTFDEFQQCEELLLDINLSIINAYNDKIITEDEKRNENEYEMYSKLTSFASSSVREKSKNIDLLINSKQYKNAFQELKLLQNDLNRIYLTNKEKIELKNMLVIIICVEHYKHLRDLKGATTDKQRLIKLFKEHYNYTIIANKTGTVNNLECESNLGYGQHTICYRTL